jgi:membrane-bound ClpP family serine protease
MIKLRQRSLLVLTAILFTLTVVFMFDDVLFYLMFERALGLQLHFGIKIGIMLVLTMLNLGLALLVIKSLNEKPQTGAEGMIGEKGVVDGVVDSHFWVQVRGERWRAKSKEKLAVGDSVIVRELEGLTLHVTREHTSANGENA